MCTHAAMIRPQVTWTITQENERKRKKKNMEKNTKKWEKNINKYKITLKTHFFLRFFKYF